jgi:hypothetical protein
VEFECLNFRKNGEGCEAFRHTDEFLIDETGKLRRSMSSRTQVYGMMLRFVHPRPNATAAVSQYAGNLAPADADAGEGFSSEIPVGRL